MHTYLVYKVCILWPAYISDEKLQCMKRKNKAWRGKKKTVAETHYDFVNLSAGMEEEKEVLYFPRFETFFFPLFFLDLTVAFSRKFTFCRGKKSKLGREGKKKKTIREEKGRRRGGGEIKISTMRQLTRRQTDGQSDGWTSLSVYLKCPGGRQPQRARDLEQKEQPKSEEK